MTKRIATPNDLKKGNVLYNNYTKRKYKLSKEVENGIWMTIQGDFIYKSEIQYFSVKEDKNK